MPKNLGPPGGRDGEGRATASSATVEQSENNTTDADKHNSLRRQCSAETHPWRRRRDASRRLPVLDCGCSGPWLHRCTPPPLSEKMIDAGRDAARHLLDIGFVPLLQLDTLRALYRRGGDDRQLARQLYELAGGEVA